MFVLQRVQTGLLSRDGDVRRGPAKQGHTVRSQLYHDYALSLTKYIQGAPKKYAF